MLIVPIEYTVDGAKQTIQMLAQALGRETQGEELIAQLDRDLAGAAAAQLDAGAWHRADARRAE